MILHIKRIVLEWSGLYVEISETRGNGFFVVFVMKNVVIDNEVIDKQAIGVYNYKHGELI